MLADHADFDPLVLDIGLPVKPRELRAAGLRMPLIILSARDAACDKVSDLEHGPEERHWPTPREA